MDGGSFESVRVVVLLGVGTLLWGIETIWPLRGRPAYRGRVQAVNLVLTGLVFAVNLALAGLVDMSVRAQELEIGIPRMATVPHWLMVVVGIAGLDFMAYLAHVAMHKTALGWRFHRVHHSDAHVDVTTAFRQHPGETLVRFGFQCAGVVVFGVTPLVFAIYVLLSALNAQFEHVNVCLPEPVDRTLRVIFVTPNMHKLHHSSDAMQTHSNYANIFSVWDRLFGTFVEPIRLGSIAYGIAAAPD